MKLLWRLGKEAIRYKTLYVIAILSTFILTVINLAAPRVLAAMTGVVAAGVTKAGLQKIWVLTGVIAGLYLLRVLFRYLSNFLAHKAAWNLVGDLRQKMYDKLQSLSVDFFEDKQTGDIMSRVINDTRDFELLYAHVIPDFFTNIVTFLGVLVMLLLINWKLALLTCCPIPLIVFSGWIFANKVRPYFIKNQKTIGELNAVLQDNLSGLPEIKAFVKENEESEKVGVKIRDQVTAMLKALNVSAVFHPAVEFMSSIGTIIVVGVGGLLAYRSALSVGDIVAFLLYLTMFYTPISGLAQLLENMQQNYAGAERVMLVLDTPVSVKDAPGAAELPRVKGGIAFENVSFSYSNGVNVVSDISFEVKPGQMAALVGPTGVGKTTLTSLLSRNYDPTGGRITIDGKDIRQVTLRSLRSNISPVPQDTFLFDTTIAENIGYSKAGATMDEIVAAAKAARIHDDILEMPEGYETVVGERGLRLSGGQKQRIAIARAILRGSPIIILDEATASVDVETERYIQRAIHELMGSRTLLVIAHRLSTVRDADIILVLEDGKIVERGSHEELLAQKGYYYRMYTMQDAAGAIV